MLVAAIAAEGLASQFAPTSSEPMTVAYVVEVAVEEGSELAAWILIAASLASALLSAVETRTAKRDVLVLARAGELAAAVAGERTLVHSGDPL